MFAKIDRGAEQASVYHSQADDLLGQYVRERLHTKEEQMVCNA